MAMAGFSAAAPATLKSVCPGLLYSVAQCCAVDVLNVASLDCTKPESANNAWDLTDSCTKIGSQPMCCTIPLAGLGVLCTKA
ncbi:hypothetical protein E4U41_002357 [Claviceps citrina]|nr:hypothetical protein E4U41_002357 [Claviceps citrina]